MASTPQTKVQFFAVKVQRFNFQQLQEHACS